MFYSLAIGFFVIASSYGAGHFYGGALHPVVNSSVTFYLVITGGVYLFGATLASVWHISASLMCMTCPLGIVSDFCETELGQIDSDCDFHWSDVKKLYSELAALTFHF